MKVTYEELYSQEYWNQHGFITGLGRDYPHPKRAHLYRGTFADPGDPLCRYGWNRDNGESYSIWRNNVGELGVCAICIKKARREIKEASKQPPTSANAPDASPQGETCLCDDCIVESCDMRGEAVECSGKVTNDGKLPLAE